MDPAAAVRRILPGELLTQAYGGRLSAYYPSFNDSPLARVHFIIGFAPGGSADILARVLQGPMSQKLGVPVVVTYHPAYLLRSLTEKAKAWSDLSLAITHLRERQ